MAWQGRQTKSCLRTTCRAQGRRQVKLKLPAALTLWLTPIGDKGKGQVGMQGNALKCGAPEWRTVAGHAGESRGGMDQLVVAVVQAQGGGGGGEETRRHLADVATGLAWCCAVLMRHCAGWAWHWLESSSCLAVAACHSWDQQGGRLEKHRGQLGRAGWSASSALHAQDRTHSSCQAWSPLRAVPPATCPL